MERKKISASYLTAFFRLVLPRKWNTGQRVVRGDALSQRAVGFEVGGGPGRTVHGAQRHRRTRLDQDQVRRRRRRLARHAAAVHRRFRHLGRRRDAAPERRRLRRVVERVLRADLLPRQLVGHPHRPAAPLQGLPTPQVGQPLRQALDLRQLLRRRAWPPGASRMCGSLSKRSSFILSFQNSYTVHL